MFDNKLWHKLEIHEQDKLKDLFLSQEYNKFILDHILQYKDQLVNLDATSNSFVVDFQVVQTHLNNWRQTLQFITKLAEESRDV